MTITTLAPSEKDVFKIVATINQLCQGRTNGTGSVTLAASAASTTVAAPNCATGASVLLTPTTSNAAAELKNGTLWVGTIANGSFTITHANGTQADRIFVWAAVG